MLDKLEKSLKAANERLQKGDFGIKIYKRGHKLSLRGTLPPKPGTEKNQPYQQYLSLGMYANAAGIQQAEKQAKKLSSQLALKEFDWQDWIESEQPLESVGYWIDKFEKDYFNRKAKTAQTLTTWKSDYLAMLKRLPKDEVLNERVLLDMFLTTEPDSRQRKRAVLVANSLAKFAEMNISFNRYKGNYSHTKNERELPTDKQIADWYWEIKNPRWQYVFGLMAAYGISNHEVFLVDLESLQQSPGHLVSAYRKAHYGVRRIWCLYPEWWQEWELDKPRELPKVSGNSNRELGSRITHAFSRYGLCKPGDLRHCWAIRAMGFMPNPMAARMMAHTEIEHNQTYQRWINQDQEDKFYRLLMERSDRPLPPS